MTAAQLGLLTTYFIGVWLTYLEARLQFRRELQAPLLYFTCLYIAFSWPWFAMLGVVEQTMRTR